MHRQTRLRVVPPPLAQVVAESVVKALGLRPKQPKGSKPLGDPTLLYFEMSEAAEYFGVEKPRTKRDRKSGMTCRTVLNADNAGWF